MPRLNPLLPETASEFKLHCDFFLGTLGFSRLMGHVNLASSSRYSHLAADQLLAASEAGSAHMNVDWSQSA